MEAVCRARYLKISQKKMIRFIKVVRGRNLDLVLTYLDNLPHKGAKLLSKAIRSAYANLVNKGSKSPLENVYVKDIKISQAFTLKRLIPRARGGANIIRKRFCNVYITVSDKT
ncbi:MAG: uL22 family ribosomal protein [Brevinematia bacterium]